MKKNKHKRNTPTRTCTQNYTNYRRYKIHIREDFHRRCGYCDAYDKWTGGSRYYHIDHFRPKKHFPELETSYSNLVYACPHCNIFKSDDWPHDSVGRYIDPCEENYNDFFSRDRYGNIVCESPEGAYVYKRLHFYLLRHSIIWNLSRIYSLMKEIDVVIREADADDIKIQRLKERQVKLASEFIRYFDLYGED